MDTRDTLTSLMGVRALWLTLTLLRGASAANHYLRDSLSTLFFSFPVTFLDVTLRVRYVLAYLCQVSKTGALILCVCGGVVGQGRG